MKKSLLLLCFVEGAAVMAAELCGAKLLAPIFGSSLYVWASVMGVTLAGLAGGYFFGGYISEKRKIPTRDLFWILVCASLFLLLMPVSSFYLVPRISYLPFLSGVFLSTMVLLFFPVFFLGATSPLFIRLQTQIAEWAGRTSGTVYAVSTTGGILSTFSCGFYFIPEFGLRITMIIFGVLLLLLTFIVFRRLRYNAALAGLAVIYMNVQITLLKKDTLFSSDSILGHLEVKEQIRNNDTVRYLTINDIVQSEMNLSNRRSVSEYVSLLDSLVPRAAKPKNAVVLGLGAGLIANLLVDKNYITTGVEFDERITEVAKTWFYLSPEVKTYSEDARLFLNGSTEKFDLVVADLFKAEEQPSHVFTNESLSRMKDQLTDSAVLLITWHGYLSQPMGEGSAILKNTLQNAGFNVKLASLSDIEASRNVIFVASLNPIPVIRHELADQLDNNALNTDDKPVLEKYNADANKAWRTQYLRYYQGVR